MKIKILVFSIIAFVLVLSCTKNESNTNSISKNESFANKTSGVNSSFAFSNRVIQFTYNRKENEQIIDSFVNKQNLSQGEKDSLKYQLLKIIPQEDIDPKKITMLKPGVLTNDEVTGIIPCTTYAAVPGFRLLIKGVPGLAWDNVRVVFDFPENIIHDSNDTLQSCCSQILLQATTPPLLYYMPGNRSGGTVF